MNCADCGEPILVRDARTWCWDCGVHLHKECSMVDDDAEMQCVEGQRCEVCHNEQIAIGKACDQLELDLARGKHLPTSPAEQFEAALASIDADDPEAYTDAECPDLN